MKREGKREDGREKREREAGDERERERRKRRGKKRERGGEEERRRGDEEFLVFWFLFRFSSRTFSSRQREGEGGWSSRAKLSKGKLRKNRNEGYVFRVVVVSFGLVVRFSAHVVARAAVVVVVSVQRSDLVPRSSRCNKFTGTQANAAKEENRRHCFHAPSR